MARLGVNLNVLNQKGSPALYTDVFAKRPAFGYKGRLFFSTDTQQIFEDTGSAWTLLSDAGSGSSNLEQVTTNGNTTDKGINITAGGLTVGAAGLLGLSNTNNSKTYTSGYLIGAWNRSNPLSIGATITTGAFITGAVNDQLAIIGTNTAINSAAVWGGSLNILNNQFNSAGLTLTLNQAAYIKTASALFAEQIDLGSNSGTITHSSGMQIYPINNVSGANIARTNYYGLLINSATAQGATRPTNLWGAYQEGAEPNYFKGNVLIGTTDDAGYLLRVNGVGYFDNGVISQSSNITTYQGQVVAGYSYIFDDSGGATGYLGLFESNVGTDIAVYDYNNENYRFGNGGLVTTGNGGVTNMQSELQLNSQNTVSNSILNTVQRKIKINVGGTNYYLLASTSNA